MKLERAPAPAGDVGREWRLAAVVPKSHAFPDVYVIDGVSAADAARLHAAMAAVRDFESRHYVYLVWRANYEEFSRYWRRVLVEFGGDRGFSGSVGTRVSLELKRLLLNYLSGALSFIAHAERCLKRDARRGRDRAGWSDFESWRKASERSFDFAFLFALRNYMQHAGLPRFTLTFNSSHTAGDNGGQFTVPSLTVDRDTLLTERSEWRQIEPRLRLQPAAIDIPTHVHRLTRRLHALANVCVAASLRVAREPWAQVRQRWHDARAQVPDGTPALVRYEQRAGTWTLVLSWFPDDAMELAATLRIGRTVGQIAHVPST